MRYPHYQAPAISRREMLRTCGCGFGGLALSSLLQRDLLAQANPLTVKPPHFAPRAKAWPCPMAMPPSADGATRLIA